MCALCGCVTEPPPVDSVSSGNKPVAEMGDVEDYRIVECLLPGQIRQLGTMTTYVTERRPVRTTKDDCVIRGGEYVVADRADYRAALKVWLAEAEKGSAEAQYYTATLYEAGQGGVPDYARAAQWYRKAAEQGDKRAAVGLGRLYEQGAGIAQDPDEAFRWFVKASGLSEATLSQLSNPQLRRQVSALETQLAGKSEEAQHLQQRLDATAEDLAKVRQQLTDRTALVTEQQRKLSEVEQRYLAAQAQLNELHARPGPSGTTLEASVQQLNRDVTQAKQELDTRNHEVARLREKIATMEADAGGQGHDPQVAAVSDVGFDGPSVEIIDPPLVTVRGVKVGTDDATTMVGTSPRRSLTGRVLAPAGLRRLTVNGEAIEPNDQGIFTATLPATRSGDDGLIVQILVVDSQNKRAALKFRLNPQGAVPVGPHMAGHNRSDFGHYHALVIGNDHYTHWPQLMNAIADASAVAKTLKERYGFQVTMLKDATRSQIMKALNQYRRVLTEKDNLLIFYAGHGHLEQGIDRGYWIPVDAETNDNSEWVLLPGVADMLQLMSAKHVMVVADSCFGGKLTRSSLAQLKPGLSDDARIVLLKTLAQKRVRTAMTSGGVKPVLDAGGSGHSVFAEALLGVLEENTAVLEAERLFWAVRARVISATQKLNNEQIPTYDPIHMAGHESLGDFIFVPQPF